MDQFVNSKLQETLRRISTLQEGQTISSSDMSVVEHNSYSTAVSRWYAGESRSKTIDAIRSVFTEAFQLAEKVPSEELVNAISDALNGLTNLKATYKADPATCKIIDTLMNDIRASAHEIANNILQEIDRDSAEDTMSEIIRIDQDVQKKDEGGIVELDDASSDLVEVVSVSDRDDNKEEITKSTDSASRDASPKDNNSVSDMDLIRIIQTVSNLTLPDSDSEASFYQEPIVTETLPLITESSTSNNVKRSQSSNVDLSSYSEYDERSTEIKKIREKRSNSTESLSRLVSESTDTPALEETPKPIEFSYDSQIYIPPSIESYAYPTDTTDQRLDKLIKRFSDWLASNRQEDSNRYVYSSKNGYSYQECPDAYWYGKQYE